MRAVCILGQSSSDSGVCFMDDLFICWLIIKDIVMEDFEDKVTESDGSPPCVWEQFVDDVIAVI